MTSSLPSILRRAKLSPVTKSPRWLKSLQDDQIVNVHGFVREDSGRKLYIVTVCGMFNGIAFSLCHDSLNVVMERFAVRKSLKRESRAKVTTALIALLRNRGLIGNEHSTQKPVKVVKTRPTPASAHKTAQADFRARMIAQGATVDPATGRLNSMPPGWLSRLGANSKAA